MTEIMTKMCKKQLSTLLTHGTVESFTGCSEQIDQPESGHINWVVPNLDLIYRYMHDASSYVRQNMIRQPKSLHSHLISSTSGAKVSSMTVVGVT